MLHCGSSHGPIGRASSCHGAAMSIQRLSYASMMCIVQISLISPHHMHTLPLTLLQPLTFHRTDISPIPSPPTPRHPLTLQPLLKYLPSPYPPTQLPPARHTPHHSLLPTISDPTNHTETPPFHQTTAQKSHPSTKETKKSHARRTKHAQKAQGKKVGGKLTASLVLSSPSPSLLHPQHVHRHDGSPCSCGGDPP